MTERIPKSKQEAVRSRYLNSITSKILGPGSEHFVSDSSVEIISEPPRNRYITGILYPKVESKASGRSSDDISGDDQDVDFDAESEPIVVDNSFKPTSIGLSFYCLKTSTLDFKINTSVYNMTENPWIDLPADLLESILPIVTDAQVTEPILKISDDQKQIAYADSYTRKAISLQKRLKNLIDQLKEKPEMKDAAAFLYRLYNLNYLSEKSKKAKPKIYQRRPISTKVTLDLTKPRSTTEIMQSGEPLGLSIFAKVRELPLPDNKRAVQAVTLVVQNTSKSTIFFQTQVILNAMHSLKFCASEDVMDTHLEQLSKEDQKIRFEYRNKKTYAIGHGISVGWSPQAGEVESIFTEYVPTYELSPMSFDLEGLSKDILRPDSYLSEVPEEAQIQSLTKFAAKYDAWIDERELQVPEIKMENPSYAEIASSNLQDCRICSNRIHQGIELLRRDPAALLAFDLANEAILLQRSKNPERKMQCFRSRSYENLEDDPNTSFAWRPFQLAFILTTIDSLINEKSDFRDVLDLIWISTGGGKTEAYLCAIALVVLYQRLGDADAKGVTVIMRYTLRLLTAQQFQRASSMICALEFLRQHRDDLGSNEISVGLWVGGGSTPNHRKEAKTDFVNLRKNHDSPNPFQVLECPWCHREHSIIPDDTEKRVVDAWGYAPLVNGNDFDLQCQNSSCPFHEKLPIYVIDDSIYKNQPTLLFGTVDKFAQVPINEKTAALFSCSNGKSGEAYKPQLIIQDELHLISGPLGSIVGLYESSFDYILSSGSSRPKYLASTATIRNSQEQVRNLFDRDVMQFPPDGLDVDDNFFVKTRKPSADGNLYGRQYVGVMGTGKTQVTTEIRLFAALLHSIVELGLSLEEQDLFWTVVGYFNSLRELGKASTLLMDDVRDELRRLTKIEGSASSRQLNTFGNLELTSHVSSSEIVNTIKKLTHTHTSDERAVDTMIATNMLSVGIDISRLNSMIVVGQPKLTSEYIQATSRVGRDTLGLVFALYSSTKSRDRSHYETFTSYHQNMYAQVEPSSVTPFSQPALDKALAAVLIGMLRHTIPALLSQKDASSILEFKPELESAKAFLLDRVQRNDSENLYTAKASEKLDAISENWLQSAVLSDNTANKNLLYFAAKKDATPDTVYLLKSFDMRQAHHEAYFAMNSMRDIENSGNISIKESLTDD
ncbi:helicase-related protein [Lacticaseibacillus zeae]|uniref:Helicase-related protein n=1 Tax=Lacticaseibacillus zeae subsp. silagei TaxID=3068307 RepID=A0ABD7Z7A4_LACZE|nr:MULTISPECIES: helicase-related protein [Lacticaseibacillus]MDE3315772.1 DNA helicase [Lacticaseibacillus zeae]OFR91600.1 DNA helicase [Lactobacillus sp. HMSC068F07]WLV82823.1 helicase-related protein [Lacticaseibacillus sp. NCIMB 15475]WLV85564.1 helicase-related protein [Lacticaseibacillus sp. NCIMB 15474]